MWILVVFFTVGGQTMSAQSVTLDKPTCEEMASRINTSPDSKPAHLMASCVDSAKLVPAEHLP